MVFHGFPTDIPTYSDGEHARNPRWFPRSRKLLRMLIPSAKGLLLLMRASDFVDMG